MKGLPGCARRELRPQIIGETHPEKLDAHFQAADFCAEVAHGFHIAFEAGTQLLRHSVDVGAQHVSAFVEFFIPENLAHRRAKSVGNDRHFAGGFAGHQHG